MAGNDKLGGLTALSGLHTNVIVRTLEVVVYEPSSKKPFTVIAVMISDGQNMTHVVENVFGTEAQRKATVQQRQNYWLPGGKSAAFRLSDFKKVGKNNFAWLSATVPMCIALEGFSTTKQSLKIQPQLEGSEPGRLIPAYWLPMEPLRHLARIAMGMHVTFGGVVVEVGKQEQTPAGPVRLLSVSDGDMIVQAKVWNEAGRRDLDAISTGKGSRVIAICYNWWIGVDSGSITKVVNVPDKSRLVLLERKHLTPAHQAYYDSIADKDAADTLQIHEPQFIGGGHRRTMQEWAELPGVQGSCFMLNAFKAVHECLQEEGVSNPDIYRLEAVLVSIDSSSSKATKNGRPFAKVTLQDISGAVDARAGEDVLCVLAQLEPEDLLPRIESDTVVCTRATVYVERQLNVRQQHDQSSCAAVLLEDTYQRRCWIFSMCVFVQTFASATTSFWPHAG